MLISQDALLIVLTALIFDALIGDPDWLWRRVAHPVVWIGALIGWLDRSLNREHWSSALRKLAGIIAVIVLVTVAASTGFLLQKILWQTWGSVFWLGLLASTLIAQRSLYQHVARVREAFGSGGLTAARRAVAMIVGRDPEQLDEAGVSRAAIESCAENFSDGVVAPVFWLALFGLPGLITYKAINTADSMIGHRSARYYSFGWAAARLDDLVNLIPARLAGVLIALAAPLAKGSISKAFKVMLRDAPKHRSPNAGWPEAAMAGALGVALAGPRRYAEGLVEDPFLNAEARHDATPHDIGRALRLMAAACGFEAVLYAALALLL
ncbi:adenosylcobinamide-phosphate synthase [Rhodopseudomonas rhenobacensis]|uniref:Cobalamin biosynthesis protein CobD n=1 Tax=Rhodopseudomonas rhenobacensis TaxID=87461 RepID=A0A7W8DYJ6_9BRAD|nr:adenosylcobinamide-phosphate synthase CbiB [Rhodopseudomonas rhenobacensis]MBB5047329.1 adenosylcobinamide-phosphate synthase [Rhodopseudomonas rhenobacensis]